MKLRLMIYVLILLSSGCSSNENEITRTEIIDGIEVVINGLEPAKEKGIQNSIKFERLFSLDMEAEEMVEIGIKDLVGFDANSEGNIFLFQSNLSEGNLIFKFNKEGKFIKSFVSKGQGPGEAQVPIFNKINKLDQISIFDVMKRSLIIFDDRGNIIKEYKPEISIFQREMLLPLSNGNYIVRKGDSPREADYSHLILSVMDSNYNQITEMGRISIKNVIKAKKVQFPLPVMTWGMSNDCIFVGVEHWGYDIHVYDFEGKLIRRITKKYKSVPFLSQQRKKILENLKSPQAGLFRDKVVMPDVNPPFQHLFVSDEGCLFVITFEKGFQEGEYFVDVFNPEGVYFARISLPFNPPERILIPAVEMEHWITVKGDRLFCMVEKDSGYKELVIFQFLSSLLSMPNHHPSP